MILIKSLRIDVRVRKICAMRYYKLQSHILRNHLAAHVFYATDDKNTSYEAVVIGKDKKRVWASLEPSDSPLDTSDCDIITEKEYKGQYDLCIDIKTGIL